MSHPSFKAVRIIGTDYIRDLCIADIKRESEIRDNLRVRIDCKPHPKSDRQLGYVWACLYPCIQEVLTERTGQKFDIEKDIHPYHVELFNEHKASEISRAIDLGLGHGPRIVKSAMSSWNAGPMSSFIEWILWFYAEKGVVLPEADAFWNANGVQHSRGGRS